jgi:hypothetical protein
MLDAERSLKRATTARPEKRSVRYKPPVEVMEGASPANLRSVAVAIAAAVLVSTVLGSNALLAWTSALPIGAVSDFLLDLAQQWQDAMDQLGMTEFAKTISALLRAFEAVR